MTEAVLWAGLQSAYNADIQSRSGISTDRNSGSLHVYFNGEGEYHSSAQSILGPPVGMVLFAETFCTVGRAKPVMPEIMFNFQISAFYYFISKEKYSGLIRDDDAQGFHVSTLFFCTVVSPFEFSG